MRKLEDLKVGTRIWVSSALVGSFGVLILVAGTWGQFRTTSAVHDIQDADNEVALIQEARVQMADLADRQALYELDIVRGVKGATSDSSSARRSFEGGLTALQSTLADFRMIPTLSPEEASMVSAIQSSLQEYVQIDNQILADYRSGTVAKAATAARLEGQADELSLAIESSLGQLKGTILSEVGTAAARVDSAHSGALRWMFVAALIAMCLGFVLIERVSRSITRPLRRAVGVLDGAAAGDLTEYLDIDTLDEIGQMAKALNASLDSTASIVRSIREGAVGLAASSDELSATAAQMSASAEQTSAQVSAITSAAEQASHTVQVVASSAEEMSSSVREIASSANEAAAVAAGAVGSAQNANDAVSKLGRSSTEIGEVVKVITSIAEQTNLLALNATIEAARAGEAGKGFAVVASEVKELAKETAKATEEIGSRISAIQSDTVQAVDAIRDITEIIDRINDIQTTIASAVEEQSVTTNEISRNAGENAELAREIASNIGGVAQAAHDTSAGASSTQVAAHDLAKLADGLTKIVSQFNVGDDQERRVKTYVPLGGDTVVPPGGNGAAVSPLDAAWNGPSR